MSPPTSSVIIYFFGFIGLAAVGFIPLRSWLLMKCVLKADASPVRRRALILFATLVVAAALWVDVQISVRIFKCLAQSYCGPSVASGWIYLAMLGVVYLAFEAIAFVFRMLDRIR